MEIVLDILESQRESVAHGTLGIILTVSLSFALSSLVAWTYHMTTRDFQKPLHFLQSLILISIVAATVMQAVGDSLSRGLGMLGALAIIRFRTRLEDPRNITFMFAALGVGIACGVYVYNIAVIGTVFFCLVAFILRYTIMHEHSSMVGELKLIYLDQDSAQTIEDQHMKPFFARWSLVQIKPSDKVTDKTEVIYRVKLKQNQHLEKIASSMKNMPGVEHVNIKLSKETADL